MHISAHASLASDKRQCGDSIPKRELILENARFLRGVLRTDYPHRIAMFLITSLLKPYYRFALAFRVDLRYAESPSLSFFKHKIGEIYLRSCAQPISGEVHVLHGANKLSTIPGSYAYELVRYFL